MILIRVSRMREVPLDFQSPWSDGGGGRSASTIIEVLSCFLQLSATAVALVCLTATKAPTQIVATGPVQDRLDMCGGIDVAMVPASGGFGLGNINWPGGWLQIVNGKRLIYEWWSAITFDPYGGPP